MSCKFLLLHLDKTERMVLGPRQRRNTLSNGITTLDGFTLASSYTVRTLGVIFVQDMSFNSRIKQLSWTVFLHLHNIAQIRLILSQNDAVKLVHAFVTSGLYYYNSLLSGSLIKSLKILQLIQNAAAHI